MAVVTVAPEVRAKSQCMDKASYASEERALRYAQKSADRSGLTMFVYPCDICSGWHMSSQNRRPTFVGFPLPTAVAFPKERARVRPK